MSVIVGGMEIQSQWHASPAYMTVYPARMHQPVQRAATLVISESLQVQDVNLLQDIMMMDPILALQSHALPLVQPVKVQQQTAYLAQQ